MWFYFIKRAWNMKLTIAFANFLPQLPNGEFIALTNHPALDNTDV